MSPCNSNLLFGRAEARGVVVVDLAGGLHVGVDDDGAHELEASGAEVLGKGSDSGVWAGMFSWSRRRVSWPVNCHM